MTMAASVGSKLASRAANRVVALAGIFSSRTLKVFVDPPRCTGEANEVPIVQAVPCGHICPEPAAFMSCPLTASTMSPWRSPERAAGLPSATATTVRSPEDERWSHAPAHAVEWLMPEHVPIPAPAAVADVLPLLC